MVIDAIVRVSFQSSVKANQAANRALVGHPQDDQGPGPFVRVNTSVFEAHRANDADVLNALGELNDVLNAYMQVIDFVTITLTRREID